MSTLLCDVSHNYTCIINHQCGTGTQLLIGQPSDVVLPCVMKICHIVIHVTMELKELDKDTILLNPFL